MGDLTEDETLADAIRCLALRVLTGWRVTPKGFGRLYWAACGSLRRERRLYRCLDVAAVAARLVEPVRRNRHRDVHRRASERERVCG